MAGEQVVQATQTLDPAGSMQRGQTLAGNEFKLKQAQADYGKQQNLSSIRKQAADSGYDAEKHKQLLMDEGYFEEALDLDELQNKNYKNEQDMTLKGFDILNKTAQLTAQIGAPGWETLRGALINSGMANEESLPVEYDETAKQIASKLVSNTDELIKVLKFRSGGQTRDMIVQGGKVLKTGDPYAGGSADKDTRGAFEKQVDADAEILTANFSWLDDKSAKLIAREQYFTGKHKSDADAAQKAYEVGYKASYGDPEETDKFVNRVLEMRKKINDERIPKKPKDKVNPRQVDKPVNANKAPQAAIDFLKKNPSMKDQFKAKYGYLPEDIE